MLIRTFLCVFLVSCEYNETSMLQYWLNPMEFHAILADFWPIVTEM